jgi:hypothetical protein
MQHQIVKMKNLRFALLTAFCVAGFIYALHGQPASAQCSQKWSWLPDSLRSNSLPRFYFYWGYNRASFSKTNLHFNGPSYDFTLYDLEAKDRPTKFSLNNYFNPTNIWIPQYNVRLGYRLGSRWALSFGVDHMKYVMTQGQKALLSGIITETASITYAGEYLHEEIDVKEDFLKFEHTDGLNLTTFDVEYYLPVLSHPVKKFAIEAMFGAGGIWVATRTDVRVFGDGLNNDFHVAGYSLAGKAGLRFFMFERLFLQFENKVGYMSLPSVLIKNDAPEIADHNIIFWEKFGAIGFAFNLKRKKSTKNENG